METKKKGISRRDFIKGAAASAVGVAAMGMFTACANESGNSTPDPTTTPATSNATDWLGEAPVIADSEITSTIDTELLIIGGGNAGVMAARKAAELGTQVLVMEKLSEEVYAPLGCDTASVNAQCYLDLGSEPLDPIEVLNEWQRRTYNRSNPALTKLFATRSGECVDWTRALVPQEELDAFSVYYNYPNGRVSTAVNHSGYTSFPGTISYRDFDNILGNGENQPAWKRIVSYTIADAQAHGAQWLWGTTAVVLCQNDAGDVVGAIGKDSDGNYIKINTSKAVLLACGDFSGNGAMVLALNDEVRQLAQTSGVDTSDPDNFRGMGQDGMGHKLGLWAGGVMEPGPRAAMNFGNGLGAPGLPSLGNYPVFGPDGKRFYNEAMIQFGGQGFFARRMAGELMCTIADGKWEENIKLQGYEHNMSSTTCDREWDLVKEDMKNYKVGPDGFEVYSFTGYGMGKSKMYAAETLEELADYLGYTGEAKQGLLDEIAHYNEMCKAKKDTDWGRDASLMIPLDTPPFFGNASVGSKGRVMSGMVQMSGLLVNDHFQVRRVDDTLIQGLFAVGNTCGGRYAVQYHTLMAGNSVGIATTHGMCVGEYIAENL